MSAPDGQSDINGVNDAAKFGDDDVASKKRKEADEYSTVFTQRLSKPDLNSTLTAQDQSVVQQTEKTAVNPEDFKGGILDSWTPIEPISSQPSNTSCGFDNTFKVLEGYLRQPAATGRKQIENFLQSSEVLRNPIFSDSSRYLRAISEESCDEVDEGPPSFLELELDARQRIQQLSDSSLSISKESKSNTLDLPMNDLLYGTSSHNATLHPRFETSLVEDVTQHTGESSEYVYHVAKGKDGRLYLRVVRSLLIDKGKVNTFFTVDFLLEFMYINCET